MQKIYPIYVETENVILLVDNTIKRSASDNNNDIQNGKQQLDLYHSTIPIATFKDKSLRYDFNKYPYASMRERDTRWVEIRANANTGTILWDIY